MGILVILFLQLVKQACTTGARTSVQGFTKCMSKSALFQLKSWARFLLPSRYVAPYHATPEPVVRRMLQLAKVSAKDVVYDIGEYTSPV